MNINYALYLSLRLSKQWTVFVILNESYFLFQYMEEDKVMEFWDQFAEESRDQQSDQSNDQCADDMEEISNINFSTTWQKESAKFSTTKNLSLLSDVNPILYDIEHNSIIEDNVHRHEDNQPLFEMNQTSHDRKNSSTYFEL